VATVSDVLDLFHAPTKAWFTEALGPPTRAQTLAWPEISRGKTTLLLAPTGSGKTLAAFLAAIDGLMWAPDPPKGSRCRVLYVSPLKALAVDVERNLRVPIEGILAAAQRLDVPVRAPSVFVRTGDTPAADRARMRRSPPDILITTPESLFLVLTSGAREVLRHVDTVIVDEIHSLVANKRGAHLFLSLERLEALRERKTPLQRVGLSATQRPLDEVARLLGGFDRGPRPVSIVDATGPKPMELRVEAPDVDMAKLGDADDSPEEESNKRKARRSLWPYLHEHILALVRAHRSTMIFVNARRLAERLASALNDLAGEELVLAHHGSVARDRRAVIEDRLKHGDLRGIVATSSLELGIDMGAVDLVIQVEAPSSVASGLQRIGRAGHSVGDTSRGVLLPKHRADLLACAATVAGMKRGEVEATFYPRNPLDVLAQQVVAIAADGAIDTADLYGLVRRAAPFADLTPGSFESVLDMLSGRYARGELPGLRARITWDRKRGRVTAREGAARLAIANAGTIPDRGLYGVFLGGEEGGSRKTSRRVGELDEEMVFELRVGDVFLLGASSWRADKIEADRVLVSPAPGEPGKMPFWHGDRAGRPIAFGLALGRLTRELSEMKASDASARLARDHALNDSAQQNLVRYLEGQVQATGVVPSERTLILERVTDPMGDARVCLLSPLGTPVHAPWCTAVLERLSSERGARIDAVWSDDGIVFRLPEADEPPPAEWFLPKSHEVTRIVTLALGRSSLFASHFREAAGRALLLPRRRPGERTPLWAQRKRAASLLTVSMGVPDFPIVLETYRECLKDVFDMQGLVETLRAVEDGAITVRLVDTPSPSPFASSLLFSFVGNFIYEGDAPLAERRAQALSIDHARLKELLGEADRRSLFDLEVLAEHARQLGRLSYQTKSADGLHDLLLELGDLSLAELEARCGDTARAWLDELLESTRALRFTMSGELRAAAIEDAGRLRDALGVIPPAGTPEAFLRTEPDALDHLVARYARTHGPFTLEELSARWGQGAALLEQSLDRLVESGKLAKGEFLPEGRTLEYADTEVLQALRRKSLARMRKQVEPVEGEVFARFLVDWQLTPRRGPDAVLDAVRQLEGCPLLASSLDEILLARVPGYKRWDLDALSASGAVVWAGIEPVGAHDGRIALYLAEHEALLARVLPPDPAPPPGPAHEDPSKSAGPSAVAIRIRELLARRGAIFFSEIARELGGFKAELIAGMWELVWAGEATNDTLGVLQTRAKYDKPRGHPRRLHRNEGLAPAGTEGRWSLRRARWGATPSETDRRAATARMLLDRYGVVGREHAEAEALPGGFSLLYDVMKGMEDAGRVRRGWFVRAMSATQFALPGADDRLRLLRDPRSRVPGVGPGGAPRRVVLAATDPANPYGATLLWPASRTSPRADASRDGEGDGGTLAQRAAGALVVLYDGLLLGWLGRASKSLLVFVDPGAADNEPLARELAGALSELVEKGKKKVLLITSIDGADPRRSWFSPFLLKDGFTGGARGLMRRAP
jgi:ATP-dependent Lhr-like helicase